MTVGLLIGLGLGLAGLFFLAVVGSLYWASRNGQFRDLEAGSRVIFDEEEPEGTQSDFFPPRKAKRPKNSPQSAS